MSSFPFARPGEARAPPRAASSPPKKRFRASSAADEARALGALKEALATKPHEEKSWLVHVQRVRPELADDEHLLGFLRTEDYNVENALTRLLRYWELRRRVFGPDHYALPLTLRGAMKDSVEAVKNGFMSLLPEPDGAGRAILYSNCLGYRKGFVEADEKLKVWWYLLHIATENNHKEVICLANTRDSHIGDFDPKFLVGQMTSVERAFHVKWNVNIVCHAGSQMFTKVANAMKAVLPMSARNSFMTLDGSDEFVLEALSQHGLSRECVPKELGGTLVFCAEAFVKERLAIEGGTRGSDEDGGKASPLVREGEVTPSPPAWSSDEVNKILALQQCKTECQAETAGPTNDQLVPCSCASATKVPSQPEGDATKTTTQKKPAPQKTSNKGQPKSAKKGRGRPGDPRMERAMEAKKGDPSLTLVAALVAGGFVFPDLDAPGGKVGDVVDSDGIKLYQRRNHLLRRIRLAKKKEEEGKV
ncbi:hypothetical protein ACHAXT_003982 [Thalassiosira profunda]